MAAPPEYRELLKDLNAQLQQILSFRALSTSGRLPLWYGRALSNVLLLIEGQSVTYVAGEATATTAKIVVITENLVVQADVQDIDGDEGTITASAINRLSITSLAANASETVFSDDMFSQWPGYDTTLTVTYSGVDEPITLPLERTMSGDRATAIVELLRELKTDLIRT
jgi:hypothetical protein